MKECRYSYVAHTKSGGGRRKGFTLVEVVISMALVVLIAAATLSTVFFAMRLTQQNNIKQCAVRETENVIVCFQSNDYAGGIGLLYGNAVAEWKLNSETPVPKEPLKVYFTATGAVAESEDTAVWYIQATVDGDNKIIKVITAYKDSGEVIFLSSYLRADA